jgi:hypothetical protein
MRVWLPAIQIQFISAFLHANICKEATELRIAYLSRALAGFLSIQDLTFISLHLFKYDFEKCVQHGGPPWAPKL